MCLGIVNCIRCYQKKEIYPIFDKKNQFLLAIDLIIVTTTFILAGLKFGKVWNFGLSDARAAIANNLAIGSVALGSTALCIDIAGMTLIKNHKQSQLNFTPKFAPQNESQKNRYSQQEQVRQHLIFEKKPIEFLELSSSIIDNIYNFLATDRDSIQTFKSTCRQFKAITLENEKYLTIAKHLSTNYSICATNLNHLPTWRQLKITQVILVGETHMVDQHRKKFADFTHLIWQKNSWALLTEGSEKLSLGTGQIKYLQNEIAKTHEPWDIQCPKYFEEIERYMSEVVLIPQVFLNMRDESNLHEKILKLELLLKHFKFLNLSIDSVILQFEKLKTSVSIDLFVRNENRESYDQRIRKDTALITMQICQIAFDLIDQYDRECIKKIYDRIPERDQSMVANIERLLDCGKKTIIIAGSLHVKQKENSPPDLLQKKKIPFLSLVPLEHAKDHEHATSCEYQRKQLQKLSTMPKEQNKDHAEAMLCASQREELKKIPIGTPISWEELLYYYIALEPTKILLKELQASQAEAALFASQSEE